MKYSVSWICLFIAFVHGATIYHPQNRRVLTRPQSPVVNPRTFILKRLCESPSLSSDEIFETLRKRGYPLSGKGTVESIFEEYQGRTRMPNHMHELLKAIARGENSEETGLLLERQIASLARRGFDRATIERHLSRWSLECVDPLVKANQMVCEYSHDADEWTMGLDQAQAYFCSEYHAIILQ
jgi:hypothetical protein